MLPKKVELLKLTKFEVRDLIAKLEEITAGCDQVELQVKHHFSKGVYAREMFIPKGTFLVGKIHKFKNLNILSQGDASVLSIEGAARISGYHATVSSPGIKRVIYAHEDCIWTTIHGTNETDLEKIEEEVIVKSYADLNEEA
jgi:hypothetical protein